MYVTTVMAPPQQQRHHLRHQHAPDDDSAPNMVMMPHHSNHRNHHLKMGEFLDHFFNDMTAAEHSGERGENDVCAFYIYERRE